MTRRMHASPKAVCGYVVGWLIVIFFVVLFSIIFSFVGTIICAAAAGMMMGAARLPWWHSAALSAVFPAVISTVFRVTKAELPFRQVVFVSILCFGIFWVIYFALWALTAQEKSHAAARLAPRAARTGTSSRQAKNQQDPLRTASSSEAAAEPELTLAMLQGGWFANNSASDHGSKRKTMEICNDTITVNLSDSNGHVWPLGRAQFRLNGHAILALDTAEHPVHQDPDEEVSI